MTTAEQGLILGLLLLIGTLGAAKITRGRQPSQAAVNLAAAQARLDASRSELDDERREELVRLHAQVDQLIRQVDRLEQKSETDRKGYEARIRELEAGYEKRIRELEAEVLRLTGLSQPSQS